MSNLLSSFVLTGALLAVTTSYGISWAGGHLPLFALVTHSMALSHFIIGDLFHWSRYPRLDVSVKIQWIFTAVSGMLLFTLLLRTGAHYANFLFIYFLAHFWKDIDLDFARPAGLSLQASWRRPKLWTGALALVAYTVLCSGLVTDPSVIAPAQRIAWCAGAILILFALTRYIRSGSPGEDPLTLRWAHFSILTGTFLLVFAWITVFHPFIQPFRYFFLLTHFISWYVFYWFRVKQGGPVASAIASEGRQGFIQYLKASPAGMVVFVVIVNLAVFGGAGAYEWSYQAGKPVYRLFDFVYDSNFRHLLGAWTVVHITYNWPMKQVKGVRVGF